MPALRSITAGRYAARPTFECARCHRQTSVTAGTILHGSKLALTVWFWAAYLMATHSNGIAAPAPGRDRFLSQRLAARRQAAQSHGRSRARPVVGPHRGPRPRWRSAPRMIPWPAAPGAATTASCSSSAPSRSTATRRAACAWPRSRPTAPPQPLLGRRRRTGPTAGPATPRPLETHDPHVIGSMAAQIHQVFSNLKGWARGVYHGLPPSTCKAISTSSCSASTGGRHARRWCIRISTVSWKRIRIVRRRRHTSKRIFERLRDEYGFTGKITIVKDYICGVRQRRREMFVPLTHPPGHAQVDFGEALAVIGGVERKIHFLAMSLPHSDACFVKAYPGEWPSTAMSRGSPSSAVCRARSFMDQDCGGPHPRHVWRVTNDRFGRPGKGNDKGKVEGIVGYCRRNFLVPMPRFRSMISTRILKPAAPSDGRNNCVATTRRSANAWNGIVRFQRLPAPTTPATSARGGSVAVAVRYRGTDYSVPTRFGHCEVLVRGYVHEVVISCAAEVIARHPRSYEQEVHYLSLLEQKTNALDQAAPLAGWVAAGVRRSADGQSREAGSRCCG